MACVFSIFVFLPLALQAGRHSFMRENQVPISTLYGILLLSDALLLNIFGFDRAATQAYFCTPVSLSVVIRVKNLAAIFLVALQSLAVPLLSVLFRLNLSGFALTIRLISVCRRNCLPASHGQSALGLLPASHRPACHSPQTGRR